MVLVLVLVIACCFGISKSQNGEAIANSLPNFDSPAVYQVTQPVDHAEGPVWDGRKNILYYVDIHTGRVLSYNYKSKKVNFVRLKGAVTPVIPAKNNENVLIVGVDRNLVAIEWDGEKELGNQRVLTSVSSQFPHSRFNDGKADNRGRLWVGTMGYENQQTGSLTPNQGVLYKISKDNLVSPKVEVAPVNISNGLCWNRDNTKMYYIDSPSRRVLEYDFDVEKGDIANPKVTIDVAKYPSVTGVPDGMTIDKDDNLWIAMYGGGSVIKANPRNGQLLQVIPIPSRDVTSVTWGGPQLDILYVTTSRRSLTQEERKSFPAAGSVFAACHLKTGGTPVYFVDVVDAVRRPNLLTEILLNTNELFAQPSSQQPPDPLSDIDNFQAKQQKPRNSENNTSRPFWATMLDTIRSIF